MKMLIEVNVNTEDERLAFRVADYIAEYGWAKFIAPEFGLDYDDVTCSDPYSE